MTDTSDAVRLRDYVDVLFRERESQLEHRLAALALALKVQHDENERRLKELNDLRSDVMKDRNVLLRLDVFYPWRDFVNTKLATLETRSVTWTAAVAVGLVAFGLVLRWFKV